MMSAPIMTSTSFHEHKSPIGQRFCKISEFVHVDAEYKEVFTRLGLTSIDSVFSFNVGKDPGGSVIPKYRSRLQFEIDRPAKTLFMKRYDRPVMSAQIKNWFWHGDRKSMMSCDLDPVEILASAGIRTPRAIAWGEQWGLLFEKRSFIITEKIQDAESLEKRLPPCLEEDVQHRWTSSIVGRRQFIRELGEFARKFHGTGYRHRDFYLCHIFYGNDGTFYLIDLQRVFKPGLPAERYRIKDIAQLHYSAPGGVFSRTDRLRFYKAYAGKSCLDRRDKTFIRKVIHKAERMARHNRKHGVPVPFTG